jgi:hypothetical protein
MVLSSPWIAKLREQKLFPAWRTCRQYIGLFNAEGHTLGKRATGNCISEREVSGQDLVNITIYRMVRPKAYTNEVRAYVHNMNPVNPPYSRSQIGRAKVRLGLHRKVGLTTSDCAYPSRLICSSKKGTGTRSIRRVFRVRVRGISSISTRAITSSSRRIGSTGR